MVKRANHYEASFEAFLRCEGVPYVSVDETRRSRLGTKSLKNVDFIVSAPAGTNWLVDVKGRRFARGRGGGTFRNWSTRDDLISLARWEQIFGPPFVALLVFAFEVAGDVAPMAPELLFEHGKRHYGFVGVAAATYARHARTISPKWGTLGVRSKAFVDLAVPMQALLQRARPGSGPRIPIVG